MADRAPLLGTAAAPVPDGAAAEWFSGDGGARLRAALFRPETFPIGSVVVSPGRTEPIEKYFEAARRLTSRGFVVLVHDWRGQGLSQRPLPDPMLGHAQGYAPYLRDFRILLDRFEDRLPRPWIALAHSMGGCLNLLALAKGERRFDAAILSAPMLGILTGSIPRPIARLVAWSLTRLGLGAGPISRPSAAPAAFEDNALTHDRARYERNEGVVAEHPELGLGSPTWAWLDFAFGAIAILAKGPELPRLTTPVTIVGAAEDKIVDTRAAEAVARRLPRGRYLEVAGADHELMQETDAIQEVFWRAFDEVADGLTARPGL